MPSEITLDQRAFKALAGDTRVAVLKSLQERRKTQTELAKELSVSAPTVKDHLEILQSAGLVQEIDDGHKWKYYQLTLKARHLLNPEDRKILILLGASVLGVLGGLYWLAVRVTSVLGFDRVNQASESAKAFGLPSTSAVPSVVDNETSSLMVTLYQLPIAEFAFVLVMVLALGMCVGLLWKKSIG